jgi:ParB family chromosome partitioning protein
MSLKSVPLSALSPSRSNPRRKIDQAAIEGLAASIKTDGVLQNLVVAPCGEEKFRIVSGHRRYFALKLLKRRKVINDGFKVPVEIRKNLDEADALRIATIENVQRANLDPIDEAEAFAAMLQNGAAIEDVSAKTGLSDQTIRRRLALADLSKSVKAAVRKGELPLSVAEALTLGTEDQQRQFLKEIREGADLDREAIRELLLAEKPSAAIAIFPLEKYTGTYTRDLFGEKESTLFDDVEQFHALQKEAVEMLAEKHRQKATWVELLNVYSAPWWQYRKAKKGEAAGVVINLKPTGRVEIEKGLVRHEVKEEVAEATRETPEAPVARPAVSKGLIRYAAIQKSMAVQAALLENPRKAKEVAAVLLLQAYGTSQFVRINIHPCVAGSAVLERKPKAFTKVRAEATRLLARVRTRVDDDGQLVTAGNGTDPALCSYEAVQALSDEELDQLCVLLVVLSFGQCGLDELDTGETLFNRVAADLGLAVRDWWTPDAEYLALMRKDQLDAVAIESGASLRLGKLKAFSKKDLVDGLARQFERTANGEVKLDEHDEKVRQWLPGAMSFPARASVTMADAA